MADRGERYQRGLVTKEKEPAVKRKLPKTPQTPTFCAIHQRLLHHFTGSCTSVHVIFTADQIPSQDSTRRIGGRYYSYTTIFARCYNETEQSKSIIKLKIPLLNKKTRSFPCILPSRFQSATQTHDPPHNQTNTPNQPKPNPPFPPPSFANTYPSKNGTYCSSSNKNGISKPANNSTLFRSNSPSEGGQFAVAAED